MRAMRNGLMGLAGLSLLALSCVERPVDKGIEQPIAFSHAVHVGKKEIACTECHAGAETGARASLPSFDTCLRCHMKPQGDQPNPKEQDVRRLFAEKKRIRWIQVNRNPGHVYFSHRAHVSIARMPCKQCHGDVSLWKEPPAFPEPSLNDMETCMDCHRRNGASNGCRVCHH